MSARYNSTIIKIKSLLLLKLYILFQDLQLEIDTERENFLSLTATGRKILSQMDGGQGPMLQNFFALIHSNMLF